MKHGDLATPMPLVIAAWHSVRGRYSAETQYARAKIALSGAGLPQETQFPEVAG